MIIIGIKEDINVMADRITNTLIPLNTAPPSVMAYRAKITYGSP